MRPSVSVSCQGHTISVWVGAWCVETLNSTGFTEGVFCNMSVKCVRGQIFQTLRMEKNKTKYAKIQCSF